MQLGAAVDQVVFLAGERAELADDLGPVVPQPAAQDRLLALEATAKAIVKVPVAAYVEKVYDEGDVVGLGIGV